MGRKGWPSELGGESLIAAVRAQLHAPAARAIAQHLAHSPKMVDELVSLGRYLGIEAAEFPELMWLVDVASFPQLPVGWLRCEPTLRGSPQPRPEPEPELEPEPKPEPEPDPEPEP